MDYRLHDFQTPEVLGHTFTLVLGLRPNGNAGCYCPKAFMYLAWRRPRKDMEGWSAECTHVKTHHRLEVTLPHIPFRTGYRFRHVGGLWAYGTLARGYYKIGR
jgi:hypothetical protein